jgi:hypothetical protein
MVDPGFGWRDRLAAADKERGLGQGRLLVQGHQRFGSRVEVRSPCGAGGEETAS